MSNDRVLMLSALAGSAAADLRAGMGISAEIDRNPSVRIHGSVEFGFTAKMTSALSPASPVSRSKSEQRWRRSLGEGGANAADTGRE